MVQQQFSLKSRKINEIICFLKTHRINGSSSLIENGRTSEKLQEVFTHLIQSNDESVMSQLNDLLGGQGYTEKSKINNWWKDHQEDFSKPFTVMV